MQTNIVNLQNLKFYTQNTKTLNNGQIVNLKILEDKGNLTYTGILAGKKLSFSAKSPLIPGQNLKVQIQIKDNLIQLIPQEIQEDNSFNFNILQNQNIANFLQQMGIIPQELDIQIFKQFLQMQLKLDSQLINKIKIKAKEFPNKEKAAAQILLMLEEKNIQATQEEILNLLELLEKNDYSDLEEQSLLNKINSTKGKWYIVPFNICNTKTNVNEGAGNIKLLFIDENILKQVNLECNYNENVFLFNILFDKKNVDSIKMNIYNQKTFEDYKKEQNLKKVQQMFNNIKVEWNSKDDLSGTGSALEQAYLIKGEL